MNYRLILVLFLTLFSQQSWAVCDCIPDPLGENGKELERISCELQLREECHQHFKRDFEKNLYMRSCSEPSFLEKYVLNPVTPKGELYCALMFATDIVDLIGALGETGINSIVTAYTWAKNTPPEEIGEMFSTNYRRSKQIAEETHKCLQSVECRKKTVEEFSEGVSKGIDVSKKALQYLMGAARAEAERQVAYWDCLKPEAQDAHVCAVVAGIFIPATKITLILKAKGLGKLSETTSKITEKVTKNSAPHQIKANPPPTKIIPLTRQEFIKKWADVAVTTPTQNKAWIAMSLKTKRPGVFFVDTQNTALKFLNDTLKDKTLVNAFGNRYNASVKAVIEEFKEKYPDVELEFYSDYKSLRAGIRGPPGKENELMAELGKRLAENDKAFQLEMLQGRYVRAEQMQTPWFRAGLGRTADEANLVTRFSRRSNDSTVDNFDLPHVRGSVLKAWEEAEQTRSILATRFKGSGLLKQVPGTNKFIPNAEVMEVVRKSTGPEEVMSTLSRRFGITVDEQDAHRLKQYFTQVDQFSPGLLIPERVAHRFEKARKGGLTVDFAGVGSQNAEATAMGLAKGKSLEDAVVAVRTQERVVTGQLDDLKDKTQTNIRAALKRHGVDAEITISGDDMLVVPNKPLTAAAKAELVQLQARAGLPSSMRTSFFPSGMMNDVERAVQSTIGEGIEKTLRKRLEGLLSQDQLKQTLFAVDMRGSVTAKGGVGLDFVAPPGITKSQEALIRREFQSSVNDMNHALKAQGKDASLAALP
ncbi:MAG: hypothetical protein ACLGG0_11550 [Bacteriovoracia bacterium]